MICSAIRRSLLPSSSSSTSRATRIFSNLPSSVIVHPSVIDALHSNKPIVALESTIITHGLPYPTNLECGLDLHQTVRGNGAVPATIALLDGRAYIGLEDHQMERLASSPSEAKKNGTTQPVKTGERDLPNVLAMGKGSVGGTTVSGTLFLAHLAGISFFATGGIGGFHRGGQTSLDISSDLPSLARHPVSVFCSGAKSILDIPRTLEFLETLGVPVSTFNPTGDFPAFYTSISGCKAPSVNSPTEAARVILAQQRIHSGFPSSNSPGHVFAVPIQSRFEKEGEQIQAAVEQAVIESEENGMSKRGKEVTPWLLKRVSELAGGSALKSNVGLVVNNAEVASKTAVELHRLIAEEGAEGGDKGRGKNYVGTSIDRASSSQGTILVFGLAAVDITSQFSQADSHAFEAATTYPGRVSISLGGVGRNVAEAAHRILASSTTSQTPAVQLIAPIGDDDPLSKLLRLGFEEKGMRSDGLFVAPVSNGQTQSTPVCSLFLEPDGNLLNGVADMDAARAIGPERVVDVFKQTAPVAGKLSVAFDGNLSLEAMAEILSQVRRLRREGREVQILFEPTSVSKSLKVLEAYQILKNAGSSENSEITICTPNEIEVLELYRAAASSRLFPPSSNGASNTLSMAAGIPLSTLQAIHHITDSSLLARLLLVKLGSRGVLSARKLTDGTVEMRHHGIPSSLPSNAKLNTTGAGDSFAGAVLGTSHHIGTSPEMWTDKTLEKIVTVGQQAAALTLQSDQAVSSQIETLGNVLDNLVE